jgi:ABC-type multidrug transport system ATPase subunit
MERGRMLVSGQVNDIVQQLQPARRLVIKTVGSLNGLHSALDDFPDVSGVTTPENESDTALVDFKGDLEAQAAMLTSLIQQGHKICSFTETGLDLEDVFMRVTTGSVQ